MEHIIEKEVYRSTWLSEKGKSISHYLTKPKRNDIQFTEEDTGLRVHVMVWDNEEKDTEISLQSGDGRTLGFKKYAERNIHTKDMAIIEKVVEEMVQLAFDKKLVQ